VAVEFVETAYREGGAGGDLSIQALDKLDPDSRRTDGR
jgi:hypothetical protein